MECMEEKKQEKIHGSSVDGTKSLNQHGMRQNLIVLTGAGSNTTASIRKGRAGVSTPNHAST